MTAKETSLVLRLRAKISDNPSQEVTGVSRVVVNSGGTGYTVAPTVRFTSGNATATATVANGVVSKIDVVSGGSGYTSTPNIVLTGGGDAESKIATLTPANVEVGDIFTAVINGISIPFTASQATVKNVVDGLASAITNSAQGVNVTAVNTGDICVTVTAKVAGVNFTITASATNGGLTDDQTLTALVTHENVTGVTSTATATAYIATTVNDATALQIWSDPEILAELNSARVLLFKGKVLTLETLNEIEEELLLLQGAVNFTYTLAMNATRYARYTMRDVQAEHLSPSEFISVARAMENRLKLMLIESGNSMKQDISDIKVSTMTRYSRETDAIVPSAYSKPPNEIQFWLTDGGTGNGITVAVDEGRVESYRSHTLKRTANNGTAVIVKNYYTLASDTFIDTDAITAGVSYSYILLVENLNGQTSQISKTVVKA